MATDLARDTRRGDLVGRSQEVASLDRRWAETVSGHLRCVLITGEPGIGKTRLAGEFVDRHRDESTVLRARGYPFGASTSYGLWIEALDRYIERLQGAEVVTPAALAPHQRLTVAIGQLLRQLSETESLIVVLDDVHLADASSWEALAYVVRNLPDSRILILLCGRSADLTMNARAGQVLVPLEQEGLLKRFHLLPLARDGIAAMSGQRLGRRPPETLVDWLFAASNGNPFFAAELLKALIEGGTNLAIPSLDRLPPTIINQARSRLADLSPAAISTLEVLAVAARSLPMRWLAAVTSRSFDSLGPILEELTASGAVEERRQQRDATYEVTHPLLRDALYETMSMVRRQSLHRALARLLVSEERLAEAGMHYARYAEPGDPEAVENLIAALREAEAKQSPHEAIGMLEALLGLLPTGDRRWRDVLHAMVWDAEWVLSYNAYVSMDTATRAMRAIEGVLEAPEDELGRAVVRLRLAAFDVWDFTRNQEVRGACLSALRVFEEKEERRLALMARHWLAWIAGVSNDLRQMEERSREVLEMADPDTDHDVVEHASGALAWCLLREGRFSEADTFLRHAIESAQQAGNATGVAQGRSTQAFERALQGRLQEAESLLGEANSVDSVPADPRLFGSVKLLAGDARAAFDALCRELERAASPPNAQNAWALVYGIIAASRLGKFDEAQAWLDAAQPYQHRIGFGWDAFRLWAAGTLAVERGDASNALPLLRDAGMELFDAGYLPGAAIVLIDLVEVADAVDDLVVLKEAVDRLREIDKVISRPLYSALAMTGSAYLHLQMSKQRRFTPAFTALMARSASRLATEAATVFHRLRYRDWEARALEVSTRLPDPGERSAAADRLRRVIDIADQGGTARRRQAATRALDRLGRAGRRVYLSTKAPSALSRREREIVDLAVNGLTAREIGKRLYISRRTVESHLTNAYAKLGVESRVELVRRAATLVEGPSTQAD